MRTIRHRGKTYRRVSLREASLALTAPLSTTIRRLRKQGKSPAEIDRILGR